MRRPRDGCIYPEEIELAMRDLLDSMSPSSERGSAYYHFMNVKPEAKQSVRFGKGGAYTDPKKKAYVNTIAARLSPYVDESKFEGPVDVALIYCFPWRKADKMTDPSIMRRMASRPDLDNLQKPVFDALTLSGMFTDDSTIVRTCVTKVRWLYAGIALKISDSSANDYTLPHLDTSW
jgi:Holliday junction resolvase RusA-like endonuclease